MFLFASLFLLAGHSSAFYTNIPNLRSSTLLSPTSSLHLPSSSLFARPDSEYDNEFDSDFKPLRNNKRNKGRLRLPEAVTKALLAGVFVLGIGTGVTLDSAINTNEKDLASRDAIDKNAPNPTLCSSYGASAMAFDQRVFVSFNPFNVYVSQADVKPACVLRQSNAVNVLQTRGLLNNKEVKSCKSNLANTWAFVGDLDDKPQLSCVYQSEDAQNEFLSDPKRGIGEDVYDDDIAEVAKKSTKKRVKNALSGGQQDSAGAQRKQELKERVAEEMEMTREEASAEEEGTMQ
ncbi:hypothetical protein TrCOL_g7590 [Triparma columacea]|uniref:DUF3172 domain-containing protein n=1 Tax=Triparma columacea TaxID=722753 RepID=A0A9W7G836_9STRA|nr:hypothetical protein TrCOL_g7590 [Triparma columacea]